MDRRPRPTPQSPETHTNVQSKSRFCVRCVTYYCVMAFKVRNVFIEPTEISAVRRLGTWAALSVTVAIAFLLLLGF